MHGRCVPGLCFRERLGQAARKKNAPGGTHGPQQTQGLCKEGGLTEEGPAVCSRATYACLTSLVYT